MAKVSVDSSFHKKIFESALEGVLITGRDGKIIKANRSLEKMFGYKKGELEGKAIELLIPTKMRKQHKGNRDSYHKNPVARPMGKGLDLVGQKADGSTFPVEISLNYLKVEEEVIVTAFVMDITFRKEAEEELSKMNQELEHRVEQRTLELGNAIEELMEANKLLEEEVKLRNIAEQKANEALQKERELGELKSRFVSMASHEFRTPLSTVLSSNALVAKYGSPELEEKRTKHINRINSAVQNLTEILNDFLSLDKLEEGKVGVNVREFDLVELATHTVDELESTMKPDQTIRFNHPKSLLVSLDRQMVRNSMVNVLANAIKYSDEGQEIFFNIETKGKKIVLTVVDQGVGIPQKDQAHMFERFFRAKNAVNIQGTGLGLNIVRKFLDLLGGTINFTSKEGEGTSFEITLPKTYKP